MEYLIDNNQLQIGFQKGNCNVLVVAFTGIGHKMDGMQPAEFQKSLNELSDSTECNVVYVIDRTRSWYNNRLQFPIIDTINRITKEIEANRVITLGNSMGGFGAIFFAKRLANCKQAIAFSPQSSVHSDIVPFETRWSELRANISQWDVLDTARELHTAVSYDLFFGADNAIDMLHSARFCEIPNVTRYHLLGCGHNVAAFLRSQGILINILKSLIFPASLTE